MSIIYGTLEKLEREVDESQASLARAPRRQSHHKRFTVKRLGLLAMLALGCYGGWLYQGAGIGILMQIPLGEMLGTSYDSSNGPGRVSLPVDDVEPATPDSSWAGGAEELAPEMPPVAAAEHEESTASLAGDAVHSAESTTVSAEREPVAKPSATQTEFVAPLDPAQVAVEKGAVSPGTALAVSAPKPDEVDQVVEKARNALSRGDFSAALTELVALAEVPEDRADYWLVKGSAHLGLGMLEPAEYCLSRAHSLVPGNAQVAVQLAIVQQENGDHTSALQILADAAEKHTHVPEVFLNMGYSQLALGAEPAARRSFRTFMQLTRNRSLYQQQRSALERWLQQASLAQR